MKFLQSLLTLSLLAGTCIPIYAASPTELLRLNFVDEDAQQEVVTPELIQEIGHLMRAARQQQQPRPSLLGRISAGVFFGTLAAGSIWLGVRSLIKLTQHPITLGSWVQTTGIFTLCSSIFTAASLGLYISQISPSRRIIKPA